MRPAVRATLAVAALCALTAPFGAAPRLRVVGATPRASASGRPPLAASAGQDDLSAVCPSGQLPDGDVCVPFDRAALRAPAQNAEGAPPAVARGAAIDQIPRKEGRPAGLDAYRLPVSSLAAAPRLGPRGGLELEVTDRTAVATLALNGQEGVATLFSVEPLAGGGLRVSTHHVLLEGAAKADYIVSVEPLAQLRDGLVVGARLGDGDPLGAASRGSLRIEVRKVREGLDVASVAGPGLLTEDRALRADPRNVLPLR